MSKELKEVLEELRSLTNNFRATGNGVSGNIVEGFTIKSETTGGPAPS